MRNWQVLCFSILMSSMHAISAQQGAHPEDLAGRWEASDGNGGQVGMNIIVSTTVASSATDLVRAPQADGEFEFALYERKNSDVNPLGLNFFSSSLQGGAVWDGRELRIDQRQVADLPEMHVKLAWNGEAKVWTGSFERGAFQKQAITLKRPSGNGESLFVGTWFDSHGLMNNCVHVAQSVDGSLIAWGDDLQVPGRMRYANGIVPPKQVLEHYGEVAKVRVTGTDRIEVESRAYTATCCSHAFTATISSDANSLIGEWLAGPNQAPRAVKWVRVEGNSCRSAASHR